MPKLGLVVTNHVCEFYSLIVIIIIIIIIVIIIIIIIIIIITIIISLIILVIIIIIIIIVPKVFSYMYNAGDMQLSLYGRPICRAFSEKFLILNLTIILLSLTIYLEVSCRLTLFVFGNRKTILST